MPTNNHPKGIPLTLLRGDAATTVPDFARSVGALAVFSDMCPLRGPAEATQVRGGPPNERNESSPENELGYESNLLK